MAMIAVGDESARNAFRAILRDDSSRPNVAAATQELDANDILEVKDLADAIERAERQMRTPLPVPASSIPGTPTPVMASSSQNDIFDLLAAGAPAPAPSSSPARAHTPVPTDDASGPALHAPYVPTPVPPPPAVAAPPVSVPKASTPKVGTSGQYPIIYVHDEDAFMNPGGRIRSLADESLQIHRPEPTLLVRAAKRRGKATMIAGAFLGLLAITALTAFLVRPSDAAPPASVTSPATTAAATTAAAKAETKAESKPAAKTTPAQSDWQPVEAKPASPATKPASGVPVFDVKSLPPAKR